MWALMPMTNPKQPFIARWAILIVITNLLLGCSKSAFEVVPVQGKVTIDGQVMSKGRVVFAPIGKSGGIDAGKPAFGVIQSDGTYILRTYQDDDGAIVGDHTVTIYDTGESPKFARLLLPKHHTVAVDEDNRIDIAITTDDIRRYGWLEPAKD
jgi:hypothetical protein